MLPEIIEAEQYLDSLLPTKRTDGPPSARLIAAARAWSAAVWTAARQLPPMPLSPAQVGQGLRLAQRPVFICGVHRSGTTLLRDLLDGHPDLVVLPSEGTYYTNQEARLQALPQTEWRSHLTVEWLRRLANPINQPPYWLLGRSTAAYSPYVDFAQYVRTWWPLVDQRPGTAWPHVAIVLAYASCTNHLSANSWVDKTPTNERFLGRIWREMPPASIIQLIREPVATLASHKKMAPQGSLLRALRHLRNSFRIAGEQSARNTPSYLLLRYEDLCADPEAATQALARFLDIEPLDSLRQPTVAGIPSFANSSFHHDAQAGQVLMQKDHSQTDGVLSASEQRLIAAYMGGVAAKQGYPLARVGILHKYFLLTRYGLLQ